MKEEQLEFQFEYHNEDIISEEAPPIPVVDSLYIPGCHEDIVKGYNNILEGDTLVLLVDILGDGHTCEIEVEVLSARGDKVNLSSGDYLMLVRDVIGCYQIVVSSNPNIHAVMYHFSSLPRES